MSISHRTRVLSRTGLALALLTAAGLVTAGPLTPPAGPIASTYKTLSEVEPRIAVSAANTPGDLNNVVRITQPGSYYLTGNIAMGGRSGVSIETSGVTLDLNGFDIFDQEPTIGVSRFGVRIAVGVANACVKNGSIRNTNSHGIKDQGSNSRFENLSFHTCRGTGLYRENPATIAECAALGCTVDGFAVSGGTISASVSRGNGGRGFALTSCGAASGCTASNNSGSGFEATGAILTNCSSMGNAYGYFLSVSSLLDSTASANNSGAVRVGSGCLVRGNRLGGVEGFAVVVVTDANNRIENNHLTNGTYGAQVSGGAAFIVGNTCISGSSGGVLANAGCTVGPTVTAVGTISSTSPYANFVQ